MQNDKLTGSAAPPDSKIVTNNKFSFPIIDINQRPFGILIKQINESRNYL